MPPKGKGKPKPKAKPKGKETHRKTSASTPASAGGGRIFPSEVIFNILSRLPVKSLLRFKCASKQWRAVTSFQSFISAHFARSPASLLVYARKPPIPGNEDHRPNGHVIFSFRPFEVEPVPDFPGSDAAGAVNQLEVIGSAPNGVVCVVQNPYAQKFTLWNPATRSTLSIPASGIIPDPNVLFGGSSGLGFDPDRNEYKLIRIVRFLRQPHPDLAELFNFKTGRWDLILDSNNLTEKKGAVAFRVQSGKCEAVVNGVPYWRAVCHDAEKGPCLKLVRFDVKASIFKWEWFAWEMENRDMRLGEIREGWLGAVLWNKAEAVSEDRVLDVWAKSENGPWVPTYRVNQRFTVVGRVVGVYAAGVMQEIILGGNADGTPRLSWTTLVDMAIRSVFRVGGSWPGTCNVVNYKESLTRMPTIRFSMIA